MKRAVMVILFLLCMSFIAAQNVSVSEEGYDCLDERITNKCSSLSTEEKIFSVLATGKCSSELASDSQSSECWPKASCDVKTTAQAAFALTKINSNINKSATWLLSQTLSPPDIAWYLQIDTTNPASCTIVYPAGSYSVSIDENKKLSTNAGACLKQANDDYWLEVQRECYGEEFSISCSEPFQTNLLYKDTSSATIYLSSDKSVASAGGGTKEKVESLCFKQGLSCDYEASLWATLALSYSGKDNSAYLPYLIVLADENSQYLPEVFLYILVGEAYKSNILSSQIEGKWWTSSETKFYTTALALYPFQSSAALSQKTGAISWLTEVQGDDGCWGSTRDTAFILHSIWPKAITPDETCASKGYYCMTSPTCSEIDGTELSYSCPGASICCNKAEPLKKCAEQNGAICASGKSCSGHVVSASDTSTFQTCCVDGNCIDSAVQETQCEIYNGTCQSGTECDEDYKQKSYTCNSGEICCFVKDKINYVLIIILSILIVLVLLGIIFRNKLKHLLLRIKSRFRTPGSASAPSSGYPPSPPGNYPMSSAPRRIIPSHQAPIRHAMPVKRPSEFDEVLKKLKEIGK